MIVVYGVRKKVKFLKTLKTTVCENCGHEVETKLAKEGGYCHVYYIPVFPYLGGYKFISCPNCGVSKLLTNQEFKELKSNE